MSEWHKSDGVLVLQGDPTTKIHHIPAQPGRSGEHYIVWLRGAWILENRRRYIKPFFTLEAAKQAAEGNQ